MHGQNLQEGSQACDFYAISSWYLETTPVTIRDRGILLSRANREATWGLDDAQNQEVQESCLQLTSRATVYPPMSGQRAVPVSVVNSSYTVSPYIPAGMNYPVIILFSIAAAQGFSERSPAHIILPL